MIRGLNNIISTERTARISFLFEQSVLLFQPNDSQSVAGAATDDTSHVLLCGSRDSQHKPQSESFVISQPLGFSPNQT